MHKFSIRQIFFLNQGKRRRSGWGRKIFSDGQLINQLSTTETTHGDLDRNLTRSHCGFVRSQNDHRPHPLTHQAKVHIDKLPVYLGPRPIYSPALESCGNPKSSRPTTGKRYTDLITTVRKVSKATVSTVLGIFTMNVWRLPARMFIYQQASCQSGKISFSKRYSPFLPPNPLLSITITFETKKSIFSAIS